MAKKSMMQLGEDLAKDDTMTTTLSHDETLRANVTWHPTGLFREMDL